MDRGARRMALHRREQMDHLPVVFLKQVADRDLRLSWLDSQEQPCVRAAVQNGQLAQSQRHSRLMRTLRRKRRMPS